MGLAKRIFRVSAIFLSINYLSFFIGIIGQIVFARILLPEDFVPFIISLSILEIIYAFGNIGLNNVLLLHQDKKNIFGTAFYLMVIIGILAYLVILIYSNFTDNNDIKSIILLLGLTKSIGMISVIYSTYLEKDFKHYIVASIDLFAKVSSISIGIYLALNGWETEALVSKEIIYTIVNAGLLFLIVNNRINYKFCSESFKMITNFSYKFVIYRLIQVTNKNIPILFLGKSTTIGSALYEKSFYVAGLVNAILSPVNSRIAYAFYTKVQNDLSRAKKGVDLTLYVTFKITLPIAFITLFYSKDIIVLIYGSNWEEAYTYLQGLSGFILTHSLFSTVENFIISRHKINFTILIRFISLILLILITLIVHFFNFHYYYIAWTFSILTIASFIYLLKYTMSFIDIDLIDIFLKPILYILPATFMLLINDNAIISLIFFLCTYTIILVFFENKKLINIMNMLK